MSEILVYNDWNTDGSEKVERGTVLPKGIRCKVVVDWIDTEGADTGLWTTPLGIISLGDNFEVAVMQRTSAGHRGTDGTDPLVLDSQKRRHALQLMDQAAPEIDVIAGADSARVMEEIRLAREFLKIHPELDPLRRLCNKIRCVSLTPVVDIRQKS